MTPSPQWLQLPRHVSWSLKSVNFVSFLCVKGPSFLVMMASYLNPSRLNIVVAASSLVGKEFGDGRITFEKRFNNSFMHALLALCVQHTFKNINMVSNLDSLDPQNRGVVDSSLRAAAFWSPVIPLSLSWTALSSSSTMTSFSLPCVSHKLPPLSVIIQVRA